MQRCILVFESAIKTVATKKAYLYQLNRFMNWSKTTSPDLLLKLPDSQLQTIIEDYLFYKKKLVSPNTIPMVFNPLELFFTMNDKRLDWKKIRKMFPAKVKKSGYGAWSHDDTKKIVDSAKGPRNKALVHFLASSGCRIGAIPDLMLKHLTEMPDGCKAILFYEGSTDEYYGFLTPEASTALDEYLERRRQDGETFEPESPLFRLNYRLKNEKPRTLNLVSLQATMINLMKYSRVKRQKVGTRYNIQLDHGFRKRFATVIKLEKKISWAVSEKLLGHKAYLDKEYFDPTIENLFSEFQKVLPSLTISEEQRLRIQNQKLEEEKSELGGMNSEINELKTEFKTSQIQNGQKIDQLQNVVQDMAKQLTSRDFVIKNLVKNWQNRNLKTISAKKGQKLQSK